MVDRASPQLVAPSGFAEGPFQPVVVGGRWARLVRYLRAHPVICLLILSPGIPEYLSSSSSLTGLIVAPPLFLLFLAFNLGLYGPGVILIREAMVRWRKGWATVILLGSAYAILEEGIALSTLFNPHASVVGGLGFYGHWLGVSWVWAVGVVMVHVVFSISLPILLLGLALPETGGRSLVSDRQARLLFGILAADVIALMTVVSLALHFWMGVPLLIGSSVTIVGLVYLARRAPANLLASRAGPPRASVARFGILGGALFFGTLLIQALLGSAHAPAPVTVVGLVGFFVLLLGLAVRWIGTERNERHLVAFATGALAAIAVFGFLAALPWPVVIVADILLIVFLRYLWRSYPAGPTGVTSPTFPAHVG